MVLPKESVWRFRDQIRLSPLVLAGCWNSRRLSPVLPYWRVEPSGSFTSNQSALPLPLATTLVKLSR